MLTFYEFDDHPGTIGAALSYAIREDPRVVHSEPPFDDVVDYPAYAPPRTAPPGRHRILVNAVGYSLTYDPEACDDHEAFVHEAFSPTGTVDLSIDMDEPELTIELKTYASDGGNADFTTFPPVAGVEPGKEDVTTVLEVTVRNDGEEPLDGVQVRGLATKVIKSKCDGNPLSPGRAGPRGSPTTLGPGEERLEYYKLTEKCPGEVEATVRATAEDGVQETARTRIVVPDTAYIVGQLDYGFLHDFEYRRLVENLRIRAVGKDKTLTTTAIDENRRFTIKVPNRFLGRYELTVTGNEVTEAIPGHVFVTAVRGKTVRARSFELGYSCEEPPLDLDFVPVEGTFTVPPFAPGRISRLMFSYECRTQRITYDQLDVFDEDPEPDAFEFDVCESSDGSTYSAFVVGSEGGSSLPLDRGEFQFSIPINDDLRPPATVSGVFTGPQQGSVTVSHPECDFLNFEAEFYD